MGKKKIEQFFEEEKEYEGLTARRMAQPVEKIAKKGV